MARVKKEDQAAEDGQPETVETERADTVKDEAVSDERASERVPEQEPEPEGMSSEAGADSVEAEGGNGDEAAEDENTKYLRLAADFQNYKRRMEKERFERYSEGKKDFAADLLPVIDNFDRALKQEGEMARDDQGRAVIEGMAMILTQLEDALAKNGVTEIEALGADFDPNFHHAVVMEPSDEYESQKVSEVLQKGFKMGDKVIRPSMVKVAE